MRCRHCGYEDYQHSKTLKKCPQGGQHFSPVDSDISPPSSSLGSSDPFPSLGTSGFSTPDISMPDISSPPSMPDFGDVSGGGSSSTDFGGGGGFDGGGGGSSW